MEFFMFVLYFISLLLDKTVAFCAVNGNFLIGNSSNDFLRFFKELKNLLNIKNQNTPTNNTERTAPIFLISIYLPSLFGNKLLLTDIVS